jgi:hypothetical protein
MMVRRWVDKQLVAARCETDLQCMGGGRPSSPRRSGHGGHPSGGGGSVHHPDGLRVVGNRLAVLNVEQAAEGGPQGGGELGPAV